MLLLFAVGGNVVLSTLHISLPAFRVAGGMLLFLQALTLTFSSPGLSSINEVARRDAEKPGDIAVFPLAFPLIASPGALSAGVTGRAEGWSEDGSVVRNDGSPWFFAGSVARPSMGTTLTAAACRNARPKSTLGV
jgi:multiple antibiotic resistance protein